MFNSLASMVLAMNSTPGVVSGIFSLNMRRMLFIVLKPVTGSMPRNYAIFSSFCIGKC